MTLTDETITIQRPSHLCNFRVSRLEDWQKWKHHVELVKSQGLDICHVQIALIEAYDKGVEQGTKLQGQGQIINLQMNNQFLYQVSRPRREPYSLDCVKPEYQRTFSSILFEAYILNKAREISREFSFRDFLELKHHAFRRIVLRLRRKGLVVANPQRTLPRFYYLTERLNQKILDSGTIQ